MKTNTTSRKIGTQSRRAFLKKSTAAGTVSLFAPFIITPANAEPTELSLLAWYGQGEPDAVGEFEERNNVKFKVKYYAGGEQMMALLAQSPLGTYDVVHADAEFIPQMRAQGFLEQLDPKDYNFDDYFPELLKFPGHWDGDDLYSVLTRFGHLGISHNVDAMSVKDASTYRVLWDEKHKGKIGHFDWGLPNLGCLSLSNGNKRPYDINEEEWQALQKTTLSLKPQIRGFYDYGGVLASLKNGEVAAMPGIGEWVTGFLRADGATNLVTTIPEEGGIQFTESFSIIKGATKPELAKKYIQYLTSVDGQFRQANLSIFPSIIPTKSGWDRVIKELPEVARHLNMHKRPGNAIDLIRRGLVTFRELPRQQTLDDWNELWSAYKAA